MTRALLFLVLLAPPAAAQSTGFPHEKHVGLFPTCRACHGGLADASIESKLTVEPSDCAACHDGNVASGVDWSEPTESPARNFVFDHDLHVFDLVIDCAKCHSVGQANPMIVVRNDATACFACHDTPSHFAAGSDCSVCHEPLARVAALPEARIAAFPRPADHDSSYVSAHGRAAHDDIVRCAVCHAKEACEVCHPNADRLAPILALESDERVGGIVADRTGRWPAPVSHDDEWTRHHGPATLGAVGSCANCHTESGCRSCHGDVAAPWLASMSDPVAPRAGALADLGPPDHPPGFELTHAGVAAAGALECATCHTAAYCEDCHLGSSRPGFHAANYLMRHASEAYARDLDCAACHTTEVFCRECHSQVGLAPAGRDNRSYHDAEPGWLISHGQAARQGLETCVSCHQQNDCLQCHSSRSGWGVNPHGPDFDPSRVGDVAAAMCNVCHLGDPRAR